LKTCIKHLQKTQPASDLPPFDRRIVIVQPNTQAGRFIARRYRLSPAVADLVANLAGIGTAVEQ
jgi:hypothetical protein